MKKLIYILVLSLFLFNCSKSDDSNTTTNNNNDYEGTMEAKINGELVVFDSASGESVFNLDESCFEPFNRIFGSWEFNAPDGHSIVLNFSPSQGLGTYNPSATYLKWDGPYNDGINVVGYQQYHFDVETQTQSEEIGAVTITSIANNRYIGAFYFTAVNQNGEASKYGLPEKVIITNGNFDIPQKYPSSCDQ